MLIIHFISASPIVLHVYDIHVDLLCFKSNDLNFLNEVSYSQKEELSESMIGTETSPALPMAPNATR